MTSFSSRRALAVTRKEIFHILRDPFTLGAALGLPMFMVIIFGIAIEFNIKNIQLSVDDTDKTQSSRAFLETFTSSNYFISHPALSAHEALDSLESEKTRAILVIPPDFQKNLLAGKQASTQILLDGSDSSTVAPILGYIGIIQQLASKRLLDVQLKSPYEIKTRYWYNPELNSKWFTIPGLNVLVLGIMSILLTALTIAREYENGSMELLLSTPIQPLEIILGKLTPYSVLGMISIGIVYIIARLIFKLPFAGSHFVFLFGAVLFLIAYLAQGLLISVVTRNQQVAMQLAIMSGMLPIQLLSGFVFPIESMPSAIQYFTMIFPARWFMIISRESFLKTVEASEFLTPFLGLSIFCLVVIFLTKKKLKKDLEP